MLALVKPVLRGDPEPDRRRQKLPNCLWSIQLSGRRPVFYLLIQEDFPHSALCIDGSGKFFSRFAHNRFEVAIPLPTVSLTTRILGESSFRLVKRLRMKSAAEAGLQPVGFGGQIDDPQDGMRGRFRGASP